MKYLVPLFVLIISLQGCSSAPTPQSQEASMAKSAITENMIDAQKARQEYLALQAKRQKESSM